MLLSACLGKSKRAEAGDYHVLQIRLARIDHVVDARAAAEVRGAGCLRIDGGRPYFVAIRIGVPLEIVEVLAQQAEFP